MNPRALATLALLTGWVAGCRPPSPGASRGFARELASNLRIPGGQVRAAQRYLVRGLERIKGLAFGNYVKEGKARVVAVPLMGVGGALVWGQELEIEPADALRPLAMVDLLGKPRSFDLAALARRAPDLSLAGKVKFPAVLCRMERRARNGGIRVRLLLLSLRRVPPTIIWDPVPSWTESPPNGRAPTRNVDFVRGKAALDIASVILTAPAGRAIASSPVRQRYRLWDGTYQPLLKGGCRHLVRASGHPGGYRCATGERKRKSK